MKSGRFNVFRRGSKTYFYSSLFFPPRVRDDVFTLYRFVRIADDYVDAAPQRKAEFLAFRSACRDCFAGRPCDNEVVSSFAALSRARGFDPAWTEAFLDAMEQDLTKRRYDTWEETLGYVYGSAEVIGLFMAAIMGLDPASYPFARLQGRAMQVINFIRDVAEDHALGRVYLPLPGSGLNDLSRETAEARPEEFNRFMRREIERYRSWQEEAGKGYPFIPRRYLIPIKTAADLYGWTARRIAACPAEVYRWKIKPGLPRILATLIRNSLLLPWRRGR